MLGDFINRILILALGYAYPGFECYKTVEKNRVDIEELRFWCKYWIIVALFTVLEKFTDFFVGWLPMYGEMKLVLFVYLWYPKTKGTGYVYEVVLRPIVSKHENDIDRKLLEWRARAWDFIIFYWQYCAKFGQTAFVQALQHVVSQSSKISTHNKKNGSAAEEPSTQSETQASLMKQSSSLSKSKKWPPSPPATPTKATIHRNISIPKKTKTVEVRGEEEAWDAEPVAMDDEGASIKDKISAARARLRRLDSNPNSPRTPRTPTHNNKLQ
ncbi:putative HVA22-like protein g [Cajanus cajan]|uniref:putative HVA22-like protein g n=1 Tax=Cajanus cajan TaxID=3821 RepID=UPI00098D9718|nr:putative HVA22-like protein g [Cajanus cajan]